MKKFRYIASLLLLGSLFFLPQASSDYLFLQSIRQMAQEKIEPLMDSMRPLADSEGGATGRKEALGDIASGRQVLRLAGLDIRGAGAEADPEAVEREVRRLIAMDPDFIFISPGNATWLLENKQLCAKGPADETLLELATSFSIKAEKEETQGRLWFSIEGAEPDPVQTCGYFQWYAILPPLFAILLALLFQRTLLALFAGVWLGSTLLSGMNPLLGLWTFIHHYLYENALLDQFRIEIIGFVIALCSMVGVLTRGGGIQGFVDKIMRFARTVRSTQFVTYLVGLAIFFDDYANCIIVGNTTRPLTDRLRISREKLSYIVDSTAAPVAGLSIMSTWIAYEVSTFAAQLPEAGVGQGGYEIFVMTLPYRFYCILTLIFIALVILLQRDFGPMLKAEERTRRTGEVVRPGGQPMISSGLTKLKVKEGAPTRWFNAFIPIAATVLITMEEMWRMGGGWSRPLGDLLSVTAIQEVLGNTADESSARAIFVGAASGFFLAVLMMRTQKILTFTESVQAALISTKALFFAIIILLLAWCIGGVCADIGTAHYLIALFKGVIDPVFFPVILFLTACIVSFATGSSWSTMSILLPNTVIFAVKMGEMSDLGALPMLVISIGAVLEGSIFGDHCSPISDTTILSSVSCATDHMDHMKTQIPYAVLTMSAAILAGYIPAACGVHPAISILVGVSVLVGFILLVGKKPSAAKE